MFISHQHQFIFIHIGKTGGTSIETALCQHLGVDFEETEKSPAGEWWKHSWAKYMRRRVGEQIWNDYFTFAFVRNPYDMILSLFSMYTQYPEYTNPRVHPDLYHPWNQYNGFAHFIRSMGKQDHEPDERWRDQLTELGAKTQMDVWNGLKNLQTSYLTDSWQAREGLGSILVDFVGRYETLQSDFNSVCRTLGLPSLELAKQGATEHPPYHECYDAEMKQIVYRHFAVDIERFGYCLPGVE
jgi:Sulfotransferase family